VQDGDPERLDLAPADSRLAAAEVELVPQIARESKLKSALGAVRPFAQQLGPTTRALIPVVTAFTVAHSITLIALMLTRPQGLLGRRELWQVLRRRKDMIPATKADEGPPVQ